MSQITLLKEVPFLGKKLPIDVVRSPLPVERVYEREGRLILQIPYSVSDAQLALQTRLLTERWLKAQARTHITTQVMEISKRLGVKPSNITIKDTRSRWGSCSSLGNLNFSWRLIMAPIWIIEYIVAHELAHLLELNHSPRFWEVVRSICPDYRSHRVWLRAAGESLMNW